MNAQFDHYRMNKNLMTAFKKTNLISVSAVLIYDKNGKECYRLTGDNPNKRFTEHDIKLVTKTLLEQSTRLFIIASA